MANIQEATNQITSTLAKGQDGSIQITFVAPWTVIQSSKTKALEEIAKEIEIPGFRKGKAPSDKAKAHIAESTIIERALGKILPEALSLALKQYKLIPAIYPKFELLSTKDGEDWQIRALTCELPDVNLGGYKSKIQGEARVKNLWAPGKTDPKKEPSLEEKEQLILRILLEQVKIDIPKLLIDEEVNSRLASLLERTEKLGLSLENYLTSIGKNPDSLRAEYELQARNTITLELILNKVAAEEGIKVKDDQIEKVISESAQTPQAKAKLDTPEQRRIIASFLSRRAALDSLVNIL